MNYNVWQSPQVVELYKNIRLEKILIGTLAPTQRRCDEQTRRIQTIYNDRHKKLS